MGHPSSPVFLSALTESASITKKLPEKGRLYSDDLWHTVGGYLLFSTSYFSPPCLLVTFKGHEGVKDGESVS